MSKHTTSRTRRLRNSHVPLLTILVGPRQHAKYAAADLDATVSAKLAAELTKTRKAVVFIPEHLPRWPDTSRYAFLDLVRQTGARARVRVRKEDFADPFQAMLATMVGVDDIDAHQRSVRGACEAAAIFHPDSVDTAAGLIADQLRKMKAPSITKNKLVAEIRKLLGSEHSSSVSRDPHQAALAYIDHLRRDRGAQEIAFRPLHYFRQDWYEWDDRIWRLVPDDQFRSRLIAFLQHAAISSIKASFVNDVICNLQGACHVDVWDHDLPFWLDEPNARQISPRRFLVLGNGMIDLDAFADHSGCPQLVPHDPRYFSTTALNFDFDPAAPCPRFLQFLDQILHPSSHDDRRIEVVQEFMGYTLLPDCRFQMMLLLAGKAHAGKSTLMEVWGSMLGEDNISHVEYGAITGNFRMNDLRGKCANFSSEIDHLGRAREGPLKQLIDGSPITVDRKHKDPLTMNTFAKLIAACNQLPFIADTTEGMWRRLIVVPFMTVITRAQVNRRLAMQLREELPGILNFALTGLRRLIDQNHFTACRVCEQAVAQHRLISDPVASFLAECCMERQHVDIHSGKLFELYQLYTRHRGNLPVAAEKFGQRMQHLGYRRRRAGQSEDLRRPRLYLDLSLTPQGRDWYTRLGNERSGIPADLHFTRPVMAPVQAVPADG